MNRFRNPFLLFVRFLFLCLFVLQLIDYVQARPLHKSPAFGHIKLQLKYFHQFQFAGYYAAVHKGFFNDEGLDVELLEGGPINTVNIVLEGKAEYGISANDILIERVNHKPIVLLASIFQSSPSVFLCLKKSNINTAHDLINKRIMLLDDFRDPELLAVFYREGIRLNNIRRIKTTYDLNDLISGKTDVLNAYSTNEPYFLKEQNIPYTIIYPQSYGIDFYGDGIFTTEQELKKHPKRVEAFLRAAKKGWEYALNHSDEIIDLLINEYGVQKSKAHLQFEAEQIKKLIVNDYVEIGHINPGRIDNIAKICSQMGMIPPNYDLDGFIYEPQITASPAWLKWSLIFTLLISSIVVVFSLYLYVFNKQLRKAVDKQTENLKLKNEELRKSEKRFREMIENLPSGAILIERDKLFTNKKAFEITEYSNEETPDLTSWFTILYPNSRELNVKIYEESKANNFRVPTDTCITTKTGKVKQVEFHAYRFDSKEIWLMNDISKRIETEQALKESEHRLRTYIEASPNGMLIFDDQAQIKFTNPAICKLLDIDPSEIKKYQFTDFLSPFQQSKNRKVLKNLNEIGKFQGEFIITSLKNKNLPVFISAVKLQNKLYLAFVLDISPIKKVENKLKIALKKAEESDRLKSAFLANMSHEIRTPMNGILGFSQLLMKENLSQKKKEQYIDILNQNGKQLLDIINNIIDISYLEVKQLKVYNSSFSISKLFSDLEVFFNLEKTKYNKGQLDVSFHNLIPKEKDQIYSDIGKIKQVLINLVNNALKFTKEGFIRTSVKISNGKIYFSIEDSGIGIPKEKQDVIFKRFGQVENIYTNQFGGAGLGLPISKGVIELMNGKLEVESQENQGAKFHFYLPIIKNTSKTYQIELKKNRYSWKGKEILVVEDVDINISFFKELFEHTKVKISICKNGKEALDFIKLGTKPDLILMDIQMPEMNGIEATKEIRKILSSTPIIAQTAYASSSDRNNAIAAGCTDYFSKPLDSEKLLHRINQVLFETA